MLLRDFVNMKMATADKTADAEGVPLTLENCKKYKKMRDLKVYGNCFQDGTPTPENPIEVQCVGELVTDESDVNYGKYRVPIICRGKNYFSLKNANATTQTINGITFTPLGDERIHVKGHLADATKSVRYALNNLYIPLKAGVYRSKMHPHERTYKFFINYGTFYTGGSFNLQGPNGAQTLPIDGYIRYVHISVSDGNTTEFDDIIELQVEKSNVSTAYEPYVEPITMNIYLSKPLQKADYIDLKNKKSVQYIDGVITEEIISVELPKITAKTTIIEVDTSLAPSNISGKYIIR